MLPERTAFAAARDLRAREFPDRLPMHGLDLILTLTVALAAALVILRKRHPQAVAERS